MMKRYLMILTALCGTITALFADMPRDYYPNSLEGMCDAELKTALHLLLKDHTRIAYGSRDENGSCTWTVFKQSDRRPDGKVWDMYSNTVRSFSSGSTSGMNIEHSVPKSWWGEGSDSRNFQYDGSFDLHHLVPSDASANSAKSNYPLGVVNTVDFNNGVSKVGAGYVNGKSDNVFEPADEYKGDFARMYLYFVTCYQDYQWVSKALSMFAQNDYPTLNAYGKSLLLQWHRQDPVSDKEINRNNAVYNFQKNRNPYIDYPELVEYIWGEWVGQEFSFSGEPLNTPRVTASVAEIDFGYVSDKSTKEAQIYLKGRNLTNDVKVEWQGNEAHEFSTNTTLWSAVELNTTGVNVTVLFAPQAVGKREATLSLTCSDLEEPLNIKVSGTVLSSDVTFPVIVGLKSSYHKGDSNVPLQLNIEGLNPQWTIDGVPATQFSPSTLSVGTHIVEFTTSTGAKGRVRVKIVE